MDNRVIIIQIIIITIITITIIIITILIIAQIKVDSTSRIIQIKP